MKIFVCIKHVPDTEARIKIAADGRSADLAGVKMIVSPFDEYALEEALLLKDGGSATEVVVASAGGEEAGASLRQALAMGADRAILVQDAGFTASDPLDRASALAAMIRAEAPALVFTGKTGVGNDDGQVGPMLGELLGWPHAGNTTRLAVLGDRFTAWRGIEGAVEVIEGSLPALIAWDKGEHEPRYASLKGIMSAKKKPLAVEAASELGAVPGAARVVVQSMELPPPRQPGRILKGEPAEVAHELARLLREEAKVI